jgi:hypothetical protein
MELFLSKLTTREVLKELQQLSMLAAGPGWYLQVSGVYWLSRASRDRDARIRTCAFSLLACMLSPGAEPTQRMVATSWPDVPGTLMRIAVDPDTQPYGPRAAAVRFLTCALALPATVYGEAQAELGKQGELSTCLPWLQAVYPCKVCIICTLIGTPCLLSNVHVVAASATTC